MISCPLSQSKHFNYLAKATLDTAHLDVDDIDNPETEEEDYAAWKLRELMRIRRDRQETAALIKELRDKGKYSKRLILSSVIIKLIIIIILLLSRTETEYDGYGIDAGEAGDGRR